MIEVNNPTSQETVELGIYVNPANSLNQLWRISEIKIRREHSFHEKGVVIFLACDQMGLPVSAEPALF